MRRLLAAVMFVTMVLSFCACGQTQPEPTAAPTQTLEEPPEPTIEVTPEPTPDIYHGAVYLFGGSLLDQNLISQELDAWAQFYKKGMRDIFVDSSKAQCAYINLWMQADNDEILDMIIDNLANAGAPAGESEEYKNFYKTIKSDFPETVFHGVDVGHQYWSTGKSYLEYLESIGKKDSAEYVSILENCKQGETFYSNVDENWGYRENCMAENFISEFDSLGGIDIMGIFGTTHTDFDEMVGSVPNMASQLLEHYGDVIYSDNLYYAKPVRQDTITINETDYTATYYGSVDISAWTEYATREFWRLEDAYEDFKDCPLAGSILPYDNYPMKIEQGQVYVIDYIRSNGEVHRVYMRSDGNTWDDMPITDEFIIPTYAKPIRQDTITIGETDYTATYYGSMDISSFTAYATREFWRLEDAYEDFKDCPLTGNVLPYDNYPMKIEQGQVFVIDYIKSSGEVHREYMRSDGLVWNGLPSTQQFTIR